MKIAYFSPLSPIKSGISEYSENELLPYLSKYCNIDIIIDEGYSPKNESIVTNFNIIRNNKFENTYDVILYHIGNNSYHEYAYKLALTNPGVVVLHDPFIGHLITGMTIGKNDGKGYIEIMKYCIGPEGVNIADKAISNNTYPFFEYPLAKKITDSSIAIIVHSEFAKKIIQKENPTAFIKLIQMPISLPDIQYDPKIKKDLKIPDDYLILGTFGYVGFHKRIKIMLRAFAKFLQNNPKSVFIIAGSYLNKEYENEIQDLIKDLDISNNVIQTGEVPNLLPYIKISNIVVQLRYPTAGETSIITLQLMGMGKPVIVSNVGSFSELPDNAVVKINVDDYEEESILNALIKMVSSKNYLNSLITNSKKYVADKHNPDRIASEFAKFLFIASNRHALDYLKKFANYLADLGLDENCGQYVDELSKIVRGTVFA